MSVVSKVTSVSSVDPNDTDFYEVPDIEGEEEPMDVQPTVLTVASSAAFPSALSFLQQYQDDPGIIAADALIAAEMHQILNEQAQPTIPTLETPIYYDDIVLGPPDEANYIPATIEEMEQEILTQSPA